MSIVPVIWLIGLLTNALPQNPPPTVPPGFERMNYGRQWNSWSNGVRQIWIQGFVEGQSDTFLKIRDTLHASGAEKPWEDLKNATFVFYDYDALCDVMTNLYADAANTYIRYGATIYIARDKLSGKDVEPALRNARQRDVGFIKQ